MAATAISIRLKCTSWEQLAGIYERDLRRNTLYLRSAKPPELGTEVTVELVIPSGTMVAVEGRVGRVVAAGEPRGPGIELVLAGVPASTKWMIESALRSAGRPVAGPPAEREAVSIEIDVGEPEEDPATSIAEDDLVGAMEAEVASFAAMNPFQILGVGYDAGDEEISEAFAVLAKKYHPDRVASMQSDRLRMITADLFVLVREAYRRIGDGAGRAKVKAALGVRVASKPARPPASLEDSAARRVAPPPPPPDAMRVTPPRPPPDAMRATPPRPPAATPTIALPPPRPPGPPPSPPQATRRTGPAPIADGLGAQPSQSTLQPPKVPSTIPPAAVRVSFSSQGRRSTTPPPAASSSAGLSEDDLFSDLGDLGGANEAPLHLVENSVIDRANALLDAARFEDALAIYEDAIKQAPGDRAARAGRELAFGLRLVASGGDKTIAARHFEAALQMDPNEERAARELASIRRSVTENRKGLLGKLLGKK